MKIRFYTLLVGLLFSPLFNLQAQSCLTGGVTFSTQEAIDDFTDDNNGCTEIEGNVTISGSDITNLDGLSELTLIKGNLEIQSTLLTDLSGLDDLEKIEGNLFIQINSQLVNFEGLGSLTTLDGRFLVILNNSLTDFSGIDNLVSFGSSIEIISNPALQSIAGINYPKTLPAIQIALNDNVTDLSPILGVDTITGEVEIEEMPRLKDLSGFDSVKVVSGNLFINNNDSLTSFTGLQNINTISGNLVVRNHAVLPNFEGLNALKEVCGFVEIKANDGMTNFDGLDKLMLIKNKVTISENANLLSFAGLDSLHTIYGDLEISENDTLLTFGGMSLLDSIGGDFKIDQNPFLRDLNGLEQLTYTGPLTINLNDSLRDVTALNNLQALSGTFAITNNKSLASLRGFNNMDPDLITSLTIKNNDALGECQTDAICNTLERIIPQIIEINASGCDSVMQVEEQCLLAPLPVEMLYFSGEMVDRVSVLQWATASEFNNDGFAIERSANGNNWIQIGFVAGQGNSNQLANYKFIDRQPLYGENYYRLRQIDYNGSFNYSEVIVLRNESDKVEFRAFPNPSDHEVTVNINIPNGVEGLIQVQDYLGRFIYQTTLNDQMSWSQTFQFETKGMYFITLKVGNQLYHEKVIYTGGK